MTTSLYLVDDLALDTDPAFIAGTFDYWWEARLAMSDDLKCPNVVDDLEWGNQVEEAVGTYASKLA